MKNESRVHLEGFFILKNHKESPKHYLSIISDLKEEETFVF